MRIPTFEAVRVLRRQLTPRASGHTNHQWNIELASGHMQDCRGVVDDLIQGQQTEIHCHDLHDRSDAAHRRADAGADEGRFR